MRRLLPVAAAFALAPACGPVPAGTGVPGGEVARGPALRLDVGGVPNETGEEIEAKLKDPGTPLEAKCAYFSHCSPVVRRLASAAAAEEGEKAMPFVMRELRSGDARRFRAACDAITGFEGWSYRRMKPKIPPEAAAEAVPELVAALDSPRLYVRDGALQALARTGKAAAPHLPRIAAFLKDDEWWLRSSAAFAILGVGSPEADACAVPLAEALVRERHIMCLNDLSHALKVLMKTASTHEEVAEAIGRDLKGMERAYVRQRGRDVLDTLGPKASAALPFVELLIADEERYVEEAAKKAAPGDVDRSDLEGLRKTREKIAGGK